MDKKSRNIVGLTTLLVIIIALGVSVFYPSSEEFTSNEENVEVIEKEDVVVMSVIVEGEDIEGSPIRFEANEEQSVMDYMIENFDLEGSEEGFVTEIEGYEQDEAEGLYWLYYVNEEMPSVGAGEYNPVNGDSIEWELEKLE